jgi:hypothetical protein
MLGHVVMIWADSDRHTGYLNESAATSQLNPAEDPSDTDCEVLVFSPSNIAV